MLQQLLQGTIVYQRSLLQAQGGTRDTHDTYHYPHPLAARMSNRPLPLKFRLHQANLTSSPRPPTPARPPPTAQLRCRHRTQPDQGPTLSLAPTHAVEPQPSPLADLAPQSALLEAAIKSKPVTYAEACGAKSIAPPKRSSVKATTRLH